MKNHSSKTPFWQQGHWKTSKWNVQLSAIIHCAAGCREIIKVDVHGIKVPSFITSYGSPSFHDLTHKRKNGNRNPNYNNSKGFKKSLLVFLYLEFNVRVLFVLYFRNSLKITPGLSSLWSKMFPEIIFPKLGSKWSQFFTKGQKRRSGTQQAVTQRPVKWKLKVLETWNWA